MKAFSGRPQGTTKERLPIFKQDFQMLIIMIQRDKSIRKKTREKLIFAYTLLYYTGCRVDEIRRLTHEDILPIGLNKMILLQNNTKTKKPRTIYLNQSMIISILEKYEVLKVGKNEYIKKYIFEAHNKKTPIQKAVFIRQLNKYLQQKLGENYGTHSFRAGYITRIVEVTGNLKTAQDLIGHTSIKTTMKYLGTTKERKLEALDKVFEG